MRRLTVLVLCLCLGCLVSARTDSWRFAYENYVKYKRQADEYPSDSKKEAMKDLRFSFRIRPYRLDKIKQDKSLDEILRLLDSNGVFSDLAGDEKSLKAEDAFSKGYKHTGADRVGLLIGKALERVSYLARAYSDGKLSDREAFSAKVQKAIIHYGTLELDRPNDIPRFHASCFAIPTAAQNIYFGFLDLMDRIESGRGSRLEKAVCQMLKMLGLQAYTQPLRHDATDDDVVSVERFRNHVWWVGGNALAYRSLLPVAAMYSSVPMVDLLVQVCKGGISRTSQNTNGESFWTEGFTSDGAGWGHGRQCLVWGYPIDGTFNALNILGLLDGTPWQVKLDTDNIESIMNFLRGGSWYYYSGYTLPCLDRASYAFRADRKKIPYSKMLDLLLKKWTSSFSEGQLAELKQLKKEVDECQVLMTEHPSSAGYNGVRWFYNNDDLIKKNADYHLIVNMASARCDGLESAADFADNYNFFPTDGMTLFQRSGDEYWKIMGGWDMSYSPGVTSRDCFDMLEPVINWRGYCSRHNYAGAAIDGDSCAAAGYMFDKINASDKKDVNDKGSSSGKNDVLYGVSAFKGYFIYGDWFVALGAGVRDHNPFAGHPLHTTIDNTALKGRVSFVSDGSMIHLPSPVQGEPVRMQVPEGSWVVQEGGFAYRLMDSSKAFLSVEEVPTDWIGRNVSNRKHKNLPQSASLMCLWIDHSEDSRTFEESGADYAYAVYLGSGIPSRDIPVEILRNDTSVQAVGSKDGDWLGVVFYPEILDASTIPSSLGTGRCFFEMNDWNIEVSEPCVLMIKKTDSGMILSVCDPMMRADLKTIDVKIKGCSYCVELPQGENCGKPALLSRLYL